MTLRQLIDKMSDGEFLEYIDEEGCLYHDNDRLATYVIREVRNRFDQHRTSTYQVSVAREIVEMSIDRLNGILKNLSDGKKVKRPRGKR